MDLCFGVLTHSLVDRCCSLVAVPGRCRSRPLSFPAVVVPGRSRSRCRSRCRSRDVVVLGTLSFSGRCRFHANMY